jgi:hypothetical protein
MLKLSWLFSLHTQALNPKQSELNERILHLKDRPKNTGRSALRKSGTIDG